jgi:hypothetical protein
VDKAREQCPRREVQQVDDDEQATRIESQRMVRDAIVAICGSRIA